MIEGMVSVYDKLPIMGENKRVLVYTNTEIDGIRYFDILADELNENYLIVLQNKNLDNENFDIMTKYHIYIHTTHWMYI